MTSKELMEKLNMFLCQYEELKELIKSNKHLYENWRAGGCTVDDNIFSGYKNIGECINHIAEELADTEVQDEEVDIFDDINEVFYG